MYACLDMSNGSFWTCGLCRGGCPRRWKCRMGSAPGACLFQRKCARYG